VLPEIPTSYELGFKTTLLRSWVLDASLFYQKIENFQAQQCTVNATTTVISCVQKNIDGVKSRGAEINLFGKVTHDLSLNTGFIWAKATYPGRLSRHRRQGYRRHPVGLCARIQVHFSGEYARSGRKPQGLPRRRYGVEVAPAL
jgi:iron complex outermembrane receptor protein